MFHNVKHAVHLCSCSPHGERGLKYFDRSRIVVEERRSPHGERGLKFYEHVPPVTATRVALLTESVD